MTESEVRRPEVERVEGLRGQEEERRRGQSEVSGKVGEPG